MAEHTHQVQIYYEDTDVSGMVYHANYLKYFERAREHLLGPRRVAQMLEEEGRGFVVYELKMNFKRGARLGDVLEIRTTVERESPYRLVFDQRAFHGEDDTLMVAAEIQLVCIDGDGGLVDIPDEFMP